MKSCARLNGPPPSPKPAAGLSVLFQTTNLICAFTRPLPECSSGGLAPNPASHPRLPFGLPSKSENRHHLRHFRVHPENRG